MRALASTMGRNAGWVATSVTRSPSIHTERPSRIESLYSSPVLIMWYAFPYSGKCFPELTGNLALRRAPGKPDGPPKALRVLDAFGDARDHWTEADLRRHLGMPSSSLNRILRGLERAGYVLRDDAGSYRLGIGAVRLGDRARQDAAPYTYDAMVDAFKRALAVAAARRSRAAGARDR